jgi:hypothetical protein
MRLSPRQCGTSLGIVGAGVGEVEGAKVEDSIEEILGAGVGDKVGGSVEDRVGVFVGAGVGAGVGLG